jgi:phenylalanyl-tRNA synthetase alpha subunit
VAEPCEECKECKDTRKTVASVKDMLNKHILFATSEHSKHSQDINSLKSTTRNIGDSMETIKTTMKEGFAKQEQQLIQHKKEESVETEALKKTIETVETNILNAFAPIKDLTNKNSSFITKMVYTVSGGLAIAYGLWWLHKNGLVIVAIPGGTGG